MVVHMSWINECYKSIRLANVIIPNNSIHDNGIVSRTRAVPEKSPWDSIRYEVERSLTCSAQQQVGSTSHLVQVSFTVPTLLFRLIPPFMTSSTTVTVSPTLKQLALDRSLISSRVDFRIETEPFGSFDTTSET